MKRGTRPTGSVLAALVHLVLVGALAPACSVFSPSRDGTGTRLASTTAAVHFSGVVPMPGLVVTLEARRPDGTFVEFARAPAATRPAPDIPGSFEWSVDAIVAKKGEVLWVAFDPTCKLSTTHVRAMTRLPRAREATPLLTYDDTQLACLHAERRLGRSTVDAHLTCGASSDGVELVAGPLGILRGDATATNQAEANILRCIERIEGNLTLVAGCAAGELPCAPDGRAITLPRLREVTGDLSLTFRGVDVGPPMRAATIGLDALVRVGGNLALQGDAVTTGSGSLALELGLPALTAVGGNVAVDVRQFNTSPSGLAALTELPHDLTLDFRAGDAFGSLLPRLARVRGNLSLRSRSTTGNLLPGLIEVDGDVVLGPARGIDGTLGGAGPFITSTLLRALRHVRGSFSYQAQGLARGALPALARVDGTLRFERPVPDRPCGAAMATGPLGTAALTANALTIEGCAFDALPVPSSMRLDATGPFRAIRNPALCLSALAAFVGLLRTDRWMGEDTLVDNGPC